MKGGNYKRAFQVFTLMQSLGLNIKYAIKKKACCLIERKKYNEAIIQLENILKEDENQDIEAYFLKGKCLEKLDFM